MKLELSIVVARRRPHRTDDRHVVNTLREVRQPVTDLDAAFAVFFVANLQRIQRVVNLPVGITLHQLDTVFDVGRFQHVGERRIGDRLATIFCQRRLRIKRLDLANATSHEQPDHAFGFRSKMGEAIRRCPVGFGSEAVPLEHRPQGQRGKAGPQIGEELSSRFCEVFHWIFVIGSSRNRCGSAAPVRVDVEPRRCL